MDTRTLYQSDIKCYHKINIICPKDLPPFLVLTFAVFVKSVLRKGGNDVRGRTKVATYADYGVGCTHHITFQPSISCSAAYKCLHHLYLRINP
jgi:hypothetical protein